MRRFCFAKAAHMILLMFTQDANKLTKKEKKKKEFRQKT